MAWDLVASGTGSDLDTVTNYEDTYIDEGERARLDCVSAVPVPTTDIDTLRDSLTWAGVEDLQIKSSGNTVSIIWRKGFPWAAIIILALVAVIVIVSWLFYREVPDPFKPVFLIAGAGLALAVGYYIYSTRR
jgi:hypothetical protein